MEVFALVGSSGTGKSHRAIKVAYENKIDLIIDDGLLISGDRIMAGISAKNQTTRMAAIKTALFTNDQHTEEARQILAKVKPERVLILGTSREMVCRIARRLDIPKPDRFFFIEEIASDREIKSAIHNRNLYGRHVVPAPAAEVKKRFPVTFLETLPVNFSGHESIPRKKAWAEQTVVRPNYNGLGGVYIMDRVIEKMAHWVIEQANSTVQINKIKVNGLPGGVEMKVELVVTYGQHIPSIVEDLIEVIKEKIYFFTGLQVERLDVMVAGISIK
ncbi:MAG: Asp23/Gls24 family envelope stress response protein [Thermincolia bacterium]